MNACSERRRATCCTVAAGTSSLGSIKHWQADSMTAPPVGQGWWSTTLQRQQQHVGHELFGGSWRQHWVVACPASSMPHSGQRRWSAALSSETAVTSTRVGWSVALVSCCQCIRQLQLSSPQGPGNSVGPGKSCLGYAVFMMGIYVAVTEIRLELFCWTAVWSQHCGR